MEGKDLSSFKANFVFPWLVLQEQIRNEEVGDDCTHQPAFISLRGKTFQKDFEFWGGRTRLGYRGDNQKFRFTSRGPKIKMKWCT